MVAFLIYRSGELYFEREFLIESFYDTKELMFCGKNELLRQRAFPSPPSNLQAERPLSC